jgi:hypothetical protein
MHKFVQLTLLIVLFTFLSQAKAAILVEPLVGTTVLYKLMPDAASEEQGQLGSAYGGRLGFQKLGFQLGVDYLNSSVKMQDKNFDDNLKMEEWAAFVGIKLPILFRLYGGYIFSSQATGKSQDQDYTYNKGSGAKVGLGFTGIPFINLNLEYRYGSFSQFELGGVKSDEDTKYSAVMFTVSLPMKF